MTDTVESLQEKVKTLKAAKASAADIKAVNDQLVALKKAAGQAKKKAEAKPDDEEGDSPAAAKAETKAAPVEAAKPAETAKPADAKPADAAKGKKAGSKKGDETPKKVEEATPTADAERKKSEKSEPRKKSEKVEAASPTKEAERKQSEKAAEPAAAAPAGGEDTIDSLTAKVAALKLAKGSPADIKAANEQLIALRKASGQARKKSEAKPDDEEEGQPAKAAEPAKVAEPVKAAEPAKATELAAEVAPARLPRKVVPKLLMQRPSPKLLNQRLRLTLERKRRSPASANNPQKRNRLSQQRPPNRKSRLKKSQSTLGERSSTFLPSRDLSERILTTPLFCEQHRKLHLRMSRLPSLISAAFPCSTKTTSSMPTLRLPNSRRPLQRLTLFCLPRQSSTILCQGC
jgi:hypothetical protein